MGHVRPPMSTCLVPDPLEHRTGPDGDDNSGRVARFLGVHPSPQFS
jgi:hypothetical protein